LNTSAFDWFFKGLGADWYKDSVRNLDQEPDGIRNEETKFEFAYYKWLKNGKMLNIGFEKTGRKIRHIETDDYIVEMNCDQHDAAYGLNYEVTFNVVNKSGKQLDISINGKDDGVIKFNRDVSASQTTLCGNCEVYTFYVGEVLEPQHDWKAHPCVMADVTINGETIPFGLGIKPCPPVSISLMEQRFIARKGTEMDVHINIGNALPADGEVRITIPKGQKTVFEQSEFIVKLVKDRDASVFTKAKITDYGYEKLEAVYSVILADGRETTFTRPLHINNPSMSKAYTYETESSYCAVNGLWLVYVNKNTGFVSYGVTAGSGVDFNPVKLGKPFEDEFNRIKPEKVEGFVNDGVLTYEVSYRSGKFNGMLVTVVYEFNQSGQLSYWHRIKNTSDTTTEIYLQAELSPRFSRQAVFSYNGKIHGMQDNWEYGFADMRDQELWDEPWVFDNDLENPCGMYWPAEYKPAAKWGKWLGFEYGIGEIKPGETRETKPICFTKGVFKHYNDFRNYVMGSYEKDAREINNHIEFTVNGGNAVLDKTSSSIEVLVNNNYTKIWEGEISVSSPDNLFAKQTQVNPEEESVAENSFTLPVTPLPGLYEAEVNIRAAGVMEDVRRLLFVPSADAVKTKETDGTLTVDNGAVKFALSPSFSDALHSLVVDGKEWLFSLYPTPGTYAWWNPFVGGLKSNLHGMAGMAERDCQKEKVSATFVEETDNFGNVWHGIRTDVTVKENTTCRDVAYNMYYLTLPGLPVLCHFGRIANNSGKYFNLGFNSSMYLSGEESRDSLFCEIVDKGRTYKYDCGQPMGADVDMMLKFTKTDAKQNLYVWKDTRQNPRGEYFWMDNDLKYVAFGSQTQVHLANGEIKAGKPLFMVFTDKRLTADMLLDLSGIKFNG
ncbi:MAG: hypothetical protein FWC95_07785, partial [Defluviitaleaceae bacterium]|nr:hypothetical protein [Defluviitaleaceae bacterium]